MRQLMISLDRQILDLNSRVARRVREYGQTIEFFIIVPSQEKNKLDLGATVHVESVTGGKLIQFFKLYNLGKKIIKNNQIEIITAQDPFFTGLVGVMLKKRFNLPLEIQLHGDFYGSDYYKTSGLGNWLRYWLGRFVALPRADKVRVVGERIKESLLKLKISEQKIEIRPVKSVTQAMAVYKKALDKMSCHNVLKQETCPGYEKIFVWAGRMDPVKNLFFLIEVFSEVLKNKPQYLLLLVGDGLQRSELENKVKELNFEENIKFVGWVYNPFVYLANADAVVFPSLSEGYGLVAMEAAAASTPVIMTDVGVANYELKPGPKVTIVPVGDKDAFVKAILEI